MFAQLDSRPDQECSAESLERRLLVSVDYDAPFASVVEYAAGTFDAARLEFGAVEPVASRFATSRFAVADCASHWSASLDLALADTGS